MGGDCEYVQEEMRKCVCMGKGQKEGEIVWGESVRVISSVQHCGHLSPSLPPAHLFPCCAISSMYSSPLDGFLAQASLRELGVQETRERGGGEGGGWRVDAAR